MLELALVGAIVDMLSVLLCILGSYSNLKGGKGSAMARPQQPIHKNLYSLIAEFFKSVPSCPNNLVLEE